MEKENKSFALLKYLKAIFKPSKSSTKKDRSNHVPRWMYRND